MTIFRSTGQEYQPISRSQSSTKFLFLTVGLFVVSGYFWTMVYIKIFGKRLMEVCSPHLYASFGTFCVQIGQVIAAHWVFIRNRRHFTSMTAICRFSNILQRLTLTRIIDRFGCKRCQKNRKDMDYKLLLECFQKYFFVHKLVAVKNSFCTYVCHASDVLFWTVL